MTRKLLTILALLLTVMQGAWARDNYTPTKMSPAPTEGPWTFNAVDNGYYGNGRNVWARSFDGMDHSAWDVQSDVDRITYQWQDVDGTGFSMHCKSVKTSQYGVYSTYTHSESVPAYTRKVLTWNYTLRGGSNYYPQNVTLYAHTDLATLKATAVDFTHDYSNKAGSTYHLAHQTQDGGSGKKETSTLTKTFEFDNRSGSSAQTKTWALLLTHVVNNTSSSADNCHQWGSFKNYSYSWATYYYKYVTFNANGGTGTMSQQTVVNSANLTTNAFTRVGYTFAGWATSENGDVVYANGAGITATNDSKGPVTLYAKWTFQGSGTENDPYLIPSADVWNFLADKVSAGNTYSGKYFRLTNNISVTTMVGPNNTDSKPFGGTFDGDGKTLNLSLEGSSDSECTAAFSSLSGATIKNLHVTGTISTTSWRPASIAGYIKESSTIENCWSEVAISSSRNDWIDGGSFVARVNSEKTLTLNGCLFTGSITYSDEAYSGGGMVGWTQTNTTVELNNCIFAPSALTKFKSGQYMFVAGNATISGNNCYYNSTAANVSGITIQGEQARTITAGSYVTINNLGTSTGTYNVSGITAYAHGIKYGDVYYAGSGDAVSLSLSHGSKTGYTFNQYTVTGGGTLTNPTTNSPTLTMTNADQTINATWTKNEVTLTDGAGVTALSDYVGQQCDVNYSRSFTSGKASTVCLPFAYAPKTGEKFYTFTDITKENGEYIADMTEYTDANLVANTPYLYMPSATGDADFSGTYDIPADLTAGTTTSGDWKFVGTYETISWTEAPTGIYGFSAQNVDEQGISQGEFVKVGAYVRVKPMRCYLKYKNGGEDWAGARGMTRAAAEDEQLPETIKVCLISANGNQTAIGTLHTQTGEVVLDGWYTLDGVRLQGKPQSKGIYVNKGKKYVIK